MRVASGYVRLRSRGPLGKGCTDCAQKVGAAGSLHAVRRERTTLRHERGVVDGVIVPGRDNGPSSLHELCNHVGDGWYDIIALGHAKASSSRIVLWVLGHKVVLHVDYQQGISRANGLLEGNRRRAVQEHKILLKQRRTLIEPVDHRHGARRHSSAASRATGGGCGQSSRQNDQKMVCDTLIFGKVEAKTRGA
eukprot:5149763-Prymnesium_polylepis.1